MLAWLLSLPIKLFFSFFRLLLAPTKKRARNAEDAAAIYLLGLEETHGTQHVPLSQTSYAKTVEKAKSDLRFMLVILTSEVHDDTPSMQRILCEDALITCVRENDVLVWAGNVAEPEAYTVSHALGVTRYPFIGIITYNTMRSGQMTCVTKIEGLVSSGDIVTCLNEAIEKYGPSLISLRADRRQQNAAREIRAEQDSAYEESLRRDRERAEQARREREEAERIERETKLKERNILHWRKWKSGLLPAEPKENKDVARISFRMPDGSRVVRKFNKETSIEDIHAWVDLHLNPVEGNSSNAPEHYEHHYNFTLAVPMPRTILAASPEPAIEYKQIYPSGSLIVEMIE